MTVSLRRCVDAIARRIGEGVTARLKMLSMEVDPMRRRDPRCETDQHGNQKQKLHPPANGSVMEPRPIRFAGSDPLIHLLMHALFFCVRVCVASDIVHENVGSRTNSTRSLVQSLTMRCACRSVARRSLRISGPYAANIASLCEYARAAPLALRPGPEIPVGFRADFIGPARRRPGRSLSDPSRPDERAGRA